MGAGDLAPSGGQYLAAGSPVGDQISPAVAFRSAGGWLVWQDNSTDGDGFGISARRLTGQLTGLSSFRVNEVGAGDQENPQVALLSDGGGLVVWQGGIRGAQSIVGRVINPDGKFAGPEFIISGDGVDNRDPVIAVNRDGQVLVVWAADGVDGSMLGVQARLLSAKGALEEAPFSVNQYTQYHQRSPSVAALTDGSFVVAWISEQQRGQNRVDVFARFLTATGAALQPEFPINVSHRPCATPALLGLSAGGFLAAWAEHDHETPGAVWDIQTRAFQSTGPISSPSLVNTRRLGFQGFPRLAADGDSVLVIYRSEGGDGAGYGIVGQWLTPDGQLVGDEFVVNTATTGDQMTPAVASDGAGRVLAVWSTFGGSARGMDLAAQRYSRAMATLAEPSAPYVFAASSSRLLVTWAELSGLPLKHYELYVDGAESPVALTASTYSVGGLAPSSSHTVRLAYVLQDGRRSPLSAPATGRTWGEDDNADGLPDDWQALHFGSNPALWPLPSADSDGDGVTDREEFLAGTDPRSAASVLKTRLTSSPQGVILSWNSRSGAFYQAQYSTSLKEWADIGAPRLAAGSTDSIPVGDLPNNAYYRVNLLR